MSRLSSLGCLLVALVASSVNAAPAINGLSLRGLTIGKSVSITIDGSELGDDARIVLDAPIASQTIKPGSKGNQVTIEITVDNATAPGLCLLRVATKNGISNPLTIGLDRLPQAMFSEMITATPIALSGAIPNGGILRTKFEGKKGEVIALDLEAQRLGAMLKPVVRLLDPRGTQLAYSPPLRALGGDPRLTTALPADGTYTIELHDQLYRGANPSHFRLKVGALQFADQVLPLAMAKGSKANVSLPNSNLAGEVHFDASAALFPQLTTVAVPPTAERLTGAAPRIFVSDIAESVEPAREGNQLPKLPAVPVGVSGALSAPGEEDRYELPVTPGKKLRFEVFAQRFGSPLDGVLTVYGPQGNALASSDDRAGTADPMLEFMVPAGMMSVQVGVKDMQERGGPAFLYRIEARDTAAPDFALSVAIDRLNIPAGGTQVLQVQVNRLGYNGPIDLQLHGLPHGLTVNGNKIAAGAAIALVTLTANADIGGTTSLIQIAGTASELEPPLSRLALTPDLPGSSYQPQFKQQLALGVTAASPIQFAWQGADTDALLLGDKLPAKLAVSRAGKTPGNVRVRLLTTQPMPKKTIKENNQDKVVDDINSALRLEGDPQLKVTEAELVANILVPADLPQHAWDLVLIADLLAADGKTVVSSIAAPVRSLLPVSPFTVELAGSDTAEGKAGAGTTGKLAGKIQRVGSFKQPIVVTLENLPKGYAAPQVIIPADRAEFELPLVFPFGSKLGELKDVKLVAVAAPVSANSVRSRGLPVKITVVAGEKPTAEPPLEVFEDDEKFIALLNEGNGKAVPENRDKFSGQTCIRINGDQRYNAKLPGLSVKVRENPGPGEVRYIRFAWKKNGGNTICLQLNHDGMWGPGGSGREGAKFRYHAGPGGECYGGSLVIDEKLPVKFEVVTRDLFADFGEFTLDGIAFSAVDGQAALFDHLYLGRSRDDFDLIKEKGK
ncbi:hypothetical protein [Anatilimnocola floriformis]|uniref:hypothetical protein n=1 Tax=Anatilimnocola floriformis TaxID=2948575 RepID=UPI0020C58D2C|nr:hypothetical protein [Anatilimnocola floriformis]